MALTPRLVVAGTPHGDWAESAGPLLAALAGALAAPVPCFDGWTERGPRPRPEQGEAPAPLRNPAEWDDRFGASPLLLLVQDPVASMAAWWRDVPTSAPAAAMEAWSQAASFWLAHLPSRRAPWLVVDVEEARGAPEALVRAIAERLGITLETPPDLSPPRPAGAMAQLLARGGVAERRSLTRLGDALNAACLPLTEPPAPNPTPSSIGAGDLTRAAAELAALGAALRRVTPLEERVQALADQAAQHERALEAEMRAHRETRDRARTEATAAAERIQALEARVQALAEQEARRTAALEAEKKAHLETGQRAQAQATAAADVIQALESRLRALAEQAAQQQGALEAQARAHRDSRDRDQAQLAESERRALALQERLDGLMDREATLQRELAATVEAGGQAIAAAEEVLADERQQRAQAETELRSAMTELHRVRTALARLQAEHAHVQARESQVAAEHEAQRHEATQQHARQQAERQSLARELEALRAAQVDRERRHEAIEQENALLVEQMMLAQEAWERTLRQQGEAEKALDALRLSAQALQERLDAAVAARAADAAAARREKDRLDAERLAVEGERVRLTEDLRQLETALHAGRRHLRQPLSIGGARIVAENPSPPYRQLAIDLSSLRHGGRPVPDAAIRIVEHHGQAGLALFAGRDGATPLARWRPTGHEGSRAYMLLIPRDLPSVAGFDGVSATDWELMGQFVAWLDGPSAALAPSWATVAARLARDFRLIEPRLRHDRCEVVAANPDAPLQIVLHRVEHGFDDLARLDIEWHAGGDRQRLCLRAPAAVPPGAWPFGEGADGPVFEIEGGGSREDLTARLAVLDAQALAFLRALVTALPSFVPNVAGAAEAAQRLGAELSAASTRGPRRLLRRWWRRSGAAAA